MGAHLGGALREELLATELSALTSEHGHVRGPVWWAGLATPRRTICDTPPAPLLRTFAFTSSNPLHVTTRGVAQSVRR